MRVIFALVLLCCNAVQANNISRLRYMLQARDMEPKMYLPDTAMLGTDLKLVVVAPHAKKVTLYGSTEPGITSIQDLNPDAQIQNGPELRLGKDLRQIEVATSQDGEDINKTFSITLDKVKDKKLVDKFYFFEALVTYENPEGEELIRKAIFFGSNANFSNNNAVKILPEPKDWSGAANLARSFIPGIGQIGGGQRF